eukprot:11574922-Ditylum_brightwellii.AAC.1
MTKELIGQCLIAHAMATDMIQGENVGGITKSGPIDMGYSRVLFWDVLRQCYCAGGIASVDASNCCDRVTHNVVSMVARKWGMPAMAMLCFLCTISLMNFQLQTVYVDSQQSYGGNSTDPFQGLCQRNGGAPGL